MHRGDVNQLGSNHRDQQQRIANRIRDDVVAVPVEPETAAKIKDFSAGPGGRAAGEVRGARHDGNRELARIQTK